jgi:hypothetical protein
MKQTLIILVCLVFFSCKKEDVNNPPYFTFDNTAREWFSELKVHDTLKFLSNLGNVRIYEVNAIQEVKQLITGNCSFITSVCSIYYEYDELMISFNRIDSFSSPTDIKISMYIPDSLDYTNLPKNVVAKARIFGDFDDYNGQVLPNGDRIFLKFPDIYQNIQFETFAAPTKTYNEVIKFKSNNPYSYYHDGWNRNYNINEYGMTVNLVLYISRTSTDKNGQGRINCHPP